MHANQPRLIIPKTSVLKERTYQANHSTGKHYIDGRVSIAILRIRPFRESTVLPSKISMMDDQLLTKRPTKTGNKRQADTEMTSLLLGRPLRYRR